MTTNTEYYRLDLFALRDLAPSCYALLADWRSAAIVASAILFSWPLYALDVHLGQHPYLGPLVAVVMGNALAALSLSLAHRDYPAMLVSWMSGILAAPLMVVIPMGMSFVCLLQLLRFDQLDPTAIPVPLVYEYVTYLSAPWARALVPITFVTMIATASILIGPAHGYVATHYLELSDDLRELDRRFVFVRPGAVIIGSILSLALAALPGVGVLALPLAAQLFCRSVARIELVHPQITDEKKAL
jgi:hypothetical protein